MLSLGSLLDLFPSLFCLLVGAFLIRGGTSGRLIRFVMCALFMVLCAASIFYFGADSLSGNGIDESVFFHIFYGMQGAAMVDFKQLYAVGAVLVLMSCLGGYWILRPGHVPHSLHRSSLVLIGGLVTSFAFFISPASRDVAKFLLHAQLVRSPSGVGVLRLISNDRDVLMTGSEPGGGPRSAMRFQSLYQTHKIDKNFTARPNLVYIYAESFERSYFDEKAFPGLVSALRKHERNALSFTDIRQVGSTGWTIGGMVASQCGIPLVTTGAGGNEMGKMDQFLPGARCLGESLSEAGYHLAFRGGADLRFAGKGKFLRNHGFADVKGLEELRPTLSDPDYLNGWGLYDDSLLNTAYEDFERLSKGNSPFGLFLLTVDTHHPNGHMPKACSGVQYDDGSNPILNAVKCSDQLIGRFLDRLFASPYAANTVVVIASDHLAMPNSARDQLEELERRNLFMVVQPNLPSPKVIARTGSTLDIGSTILHILTGEAHGLGLGRSLLDSGGQNLVELLGEEIDSQLDEWSPDIRRLWQLPQIGKPIQVAVEEQALIVGERKVQFPALIDLDDDLNITKIWFPDPDRTLRERALSEKGRKVIWIDSCQEMRIFSKDLTSDTFCFLAGIVGSANAYIQPLLENIELPLEELENAIF